MTHDEITLTDRRPRILALANQKGGVGKTTTAINLGTALAATGENVLILDLDPQRNASTGLGIDRKARKISTYHVMSGDASLEEAVVETVIPRLYVAPSTLDLLGVELEISQDRSRPFRLRNAIETMLAAQVKDGFTYILIDCPPSLNLLTVNALAASDAVLVPLQCEFFALEGLSQLLKTVEQVRVSLNEVADNSDSNAPSRSLHIHVEDDGPGMSAAQLASAGQRGLRFDESVSGTGLGLAIARQIALAYGGELRLAKSEALKGLRATLVLKL